MSQANLALLEADPVSVLDRFRTQDECWVHHLEPETKQQSIQWKHPSSPPPKKAKMMSLAGKVMASVFWDAKGIVFIDYLQKGQTINGDYYIPLYPLAETAAKCNQVKTTRFTRTMLLHTSQWLQWLLCVTAGGFELVDHLHIHLILHHVFFVPQHTHYKKKTWLGSRYRTDDEVISAHFVKFNRCTIVRL